MGTRVSARLRGTQTNEWQPIPDEWLNEQSDSGHHDSSEDENAGLQPTKRGVDKQDDSDSELTELSDDSDDPDVKAEEPEASDEQAADSTVEEKGIRKKDVETSTTDGFIEWETVRPSNKVPTFVHNSPFTPRFVSPWKSGNRLRNNLIKRPTT
jgi:hypothetical protein